ncbi:MAG: DUF4358 domain-containing protein [Oscillospiraceae bacterium]|nr:DUF4358 domain-containing protein [Oscillospiraceae bacterium]
MKTKFKKNKIFKISSLLLTSVLMTSVSGCNKNQSESSEAIDLSTSYISNYIKNNVVFKDDLQKIDDEEILQKLYPGIDISYISEFSVSTSASGATAEELSIFKLNNKAYIDDIKQIINNRIAEQKSNFENYIPEEVYKIENSVINENKDENIVAYISCDTPDDIEILFEKLYNK